MDLVLYLLILIVAFVAISCWEPFGPVDDISLEWLTGHDSTIRLVGTYLVRVISAVGVAITLAIVSVG